MRRLASTSVLIGLLLVVVGGCGGSRETTSTLYHGESVPSSVGVVKARVENRIRERNGPFAADCMRAPHHPDAESGHEVWECKLITDFGGFRVRVEILVDPSDGNYSILQCQAHHAPIDVCERID